MTSSDIFKYIPYFIIVFTVILVVVNKDKSSLERSKILFQYSVIPTLAYFVIGHLFLTDKVRKDQGWSDDTGVITLQREIGLTTLVLFIVACVSTDYPQYVSVIYGGMLVLFGINHALISGSKNIHTIIFDIIYGVMLLYLFRI